MASIIEICGVPGVGKTTIYKELSRQWSAVQQYVPSHLLYPQRKFKTGFLGRWMARLEGLCRHRDDFIDVTKMKQYEDRFLTENEEYMNACWANLSGYAANSNQVSALRFDKMRYLYQTIQRVQFLKELKADKAVVLDEGLVHRTLNGLFCRRIKQEDEEMLQAFSDLLPLPNALVYIKNKEVEIAKRLVNRKKVIVAHRFLTVSELEQESRSSLERMDFFIELLMQKGVPVLCLYSNVPVVVNADKIIRFISNVNKRSGSMNIVEPD